MTENIRPSFPTPVVPENETVEEEESRLESELLAHTESEAQGWCRTEQILACQRRLAEIRGNE